MTRWLLLSTALSIIESAYSQGQETLNITVPAGSTYDGKSKLLCTPIKWQQGVAFYFANYFAHAATVRMRPGEQWPFVICTILLALFVPHAGLYRAMSAIHRRAVFHGETFGGSDLRMAARAGALCVVVRGDGWKPSMAQRSLQGVTFRLPSPTEEHWDSKERSRRLEGQNLQ